ncbi:GroES (chaperonin 10)-like protein [Pseudocohnilembus persalinus]|uniref:GroES (Chaperonin 10)-like protein n=1 Tax=Pseudocohnilembus persalinus TaxID=266149 RepID=A0A0V0QT44_PSEPJ|nr:GroES (chaperonin 10)-like protein [Pseudocohnilembus persalinus]|eukprot:KRX05064.1 GroES (chaperonin 10)-like protein [Pseudocohnilembus persalinus]
MSQVQIPKKVKGVVIQQKGQKATYGEVDMPELVEGDILVQVAAGPINPSDLSFLQGVYPSERSYPCIAGNEGSGTVIFGKGSSEEKLVGKRIAFHPKQGGNLGSYGEYCVTTIKQIVILPEDVSTENGACTFVNPFTVAYMLETVKKHQLKSVVHNVGSSQLGKQMQRYFTDNGVNVINIVRRDQQVQDLQKDGAKYVLNQSEEGFWEKLKKLTLELDARIAFDAIGGEFTSNLVTHLPNDSYIYVYGILSDDLFPKISLTNLLFNGISLNGYWLVREMKNTPQEKVIQLAQKVSSLLSTTFSSTISQKVKYEDFEKGIELYKKNMSNGKILLTSPQNI